MIATETIIREYHDYLGQKDFVCIAAKAALSQHQVSCFVADHMACPKDDRQILDFLYGFIDSYRLSEPLYHSAAVIFRNPSCFKEPMYDELLWQRLQALHDLDSKMYPHDARVSADPSSPDFSFSLKQEAFFIIGLHPESSRPTRRFSYPAIAFNPHAQFEKLRETNRYGRMKDVVRKRDIALSGSVNPMLEDFGHSSEVYQYSGLAYDQSWQCPLHIKHENQHHPAP